MAIWIAVLAFGGLAVVSLVLWDRMGRLEFEIKRLKSSLQQARVQGIAAPPSQPAMAGGTVLPDAMQPSLPLEAPPAAAPEPPKPKVSAPPSWPAAETVASTAQSADGHEAPQRQETAAAEAAQPAAPKAPPSKPDRAARRRGFEQLIGARLAVWGGGIALAMAGFFLVKYSVEIGLITPPVRMVLGGLFGLALLAAAEAVHRRPAFANGARIAQSLAGAGIAVLYTVLYITTSIYALIPPAVGFVGLAATTATALALSLRRGAPIAVMGLIGGYATPALVSTSSPNIPILMLYLVLVIGGLMLLIRRQGWWWLAIPAALGGFGWVGLILTSGLAAENSVWIALFLLAMTGMVFATSAEDHAIPARELLRSIRPLMPILTGGVALAQLAIVVGVSGFDWIDWGLFGLLAAACVLLGARNPNCALLPPIALTVALTLLALWPDVDTLRFIIMAVAFLALFAGAGYRLVWTRKRPLLWLGQALAASAGLYAVAYLKLGVAPIGLISDFGWATLAVALAIPAALTAAGAHARRAVIGPATDWLILPAGTVASAFVGVALLLTVPAVQLPFALALQTLATVYIARRFEVDILNWLVAPLGAAFAIAFLMVPGTPYVDALSRLILLDAWPGRAIVLGSTIWVLVLPAAVAAISARIARWPSHRLVFSWTSTALATLALAAIVPIAWLPLAITAEALALMLLGRRFAWRTLVDQSFAAVVIFGIQILPILNDILFATAPSLIGQPVDAGQLPRLGDVLRVVVLPSVPLAVMAWLFPADRPQGLRQGLAGGVGAALLLFGYLAVKTLFGIDGAEAFRQLGFLERALITQAIFALGAAAFWAHQRMGHDAIFRAGLVLTGVALARLVWFDLVVFNPILRTQDVGGLPMLNGLLVTYGLPILWLIYLHRVAIPRPALAKVAFAAKAGVLTLITILALLQVRQLFHGGFLTAWALTTPELYGYSAAALATAIGFLLWGVARRDQMARLASLGLMLAAIGKVFLYDASALTGLWRIAAFAGLGICLLGISWLYGRYVFTARGTSSETLNLTESTSEPAR